MIRKCGLDLNMTQFLRPNFLDTISLSIERWEGVDTQINGRTSLDMSIRIRFAYLEYLHFVTNLNAMMWYMC